MASRPPTPYEVFGPTPFEGDQLAPLGGLGGEILNGFQPPQDVPLADMVHASVQPAPPAEEQIIDKLKPGSELHKNVIQKLDAMLTYSSNAMRQHYDRWNFMERKVQAFIHDQDYESLLESLREKGTLPPEPIQVVVPYTYATMHAAATYISTVLLSRKPIFNLNATRGTAIDNARYMEQAIQYNLDESGGHEMLWQQIWDGLNYGAGTTSISWEEHFGPIMQMQGMQRTFEDGLIFAGNKLAAVDPYNHFPDPRVPIHQCNKRGDFEFVRMEVSKTILRDMEKRNALKWVEVACKGNRQRQIDGNNPSDRRIRIGESVANQLEPKDVTAFVCIHQGTVRLVPKEWGLGDKDTSELWKFTWTKHGQIMQAMPLGMMHKMHPFVSQEPNTLGYEFMSLSLGEMITVFQDIISWLVSSRMENVRAAINNTFIADPQRVEVNDIRSSTIGRVIRLKQAAMGTPIQEAIQQLATTDVTGGHLADMQNLRLLADATTGVNDNLRGIQTQGGRRSATEARMSMQAGASRLSQLAVRISSQSLQTMAQQMILNIQQYMPPEMWIETTGDQGKWSSQQVTPAMLAGTFNFMVTDGSLPVDKAALVEVWKEILFGIARDPELRQRFDLAQIFKYTAELGGAKNIDSFERQMPEIAPPGVEPEGQPVGAALPPPPPDRVFA